MVSSASVLPLEVDSFQKVFGILLGGLLKVIRRLSEGFGKVFGFLYYLQRECCNTVDDACGGLKILLQYVGGQGYIGWTDG